MTTQTNIQTIQNFYTNHVVPCLDKSLTFLGNCEFTKHFTITTQSDNHLDNQTFMDPNTQRERKFLLFGEVASAECRTKVGAQGNHYSGSTNEVHLLFSYSNITHILSDQHTPIKGGSRAKDILKLREPMHATNDIEILFANQAVPLKEVIIANIEKDNKVNKVCSCKQVPESQLLTTIV